MNKKGSTAHIMGIMLASIVIVLVVLAFGGKLISFGKTGVSLLNQSDDQGGTIKKDVPALANAFSIKDAHVGGKDINPEPLSTQFQKDFTKTGCSPCILGVTFDREIKIFNTSYFFVYEFISGGFLGKDDRKQRFGFKSSINKANPKMIIISGFQSGKYYSVVFNQNIKYIEKDSNAKLKMNSATSVLRFKT